MSAMTYTQYKRYQRLEERLKKEMALRVKAEQERDLEARRRELAEEELSEFFYFVTKHNERRETRDGAY